MKRRTISMLLVACMTISMLAAIAAPALAASGDLPSTMWVSPSDTNGIPVRIELNPDVSSSGGYPGGCNPGGGGGAGTSSTAYNLFLPGDAVPSECFFSWDDGLEASDGESTYESGSLPIPAPGETKTFTFTNEAGTSTHFDVTVYQGAAEVPPVFIQIDESQGTIAAMNNDQDHETTCTGEIYIDGVKYAMPQMKGRGNSSWMMAKTKKPYNVTLSSKVNLLGIDSEKTKKWSFLANCDEPSLLRDQLGYDMAHAMGVGLDSAQADVWMNGKYLGIYLITPKYDSFVPKNGFLIENDNYKEDPVENGGDPSFDLEGLIYSSHPAEYDYNRITVKKIGDNLLDGGVENVETLKAAGERIRIYTQEVWDAIRSADGCNSQGNYYADYIDMRSWATMYLLQDYIKNYDFCGGSIFFHRDGQTEADKLYAGPLWDLDLGFGCPQKNSTLGSQLDLQDGTGWFVRNVADSPKNSIFKVVGRHEDFMEEVSRVYNLYRPVFDNAPAHLEELAQNIRASAEMNKVVTANEQQSTLYMRAQAVKQSGTEYEQVYKATNTWRDYVDNVKTYVTARSAFVRDNLSDGSEEGFPALFQPGTNCSVTVYDTQDLSGAGTENPTSAYARNAETGQIDVSGEGQINFKVDLKTGWQIKSVTVEPAENFKNLKSLDEAGADNAYRITKITGPLTVRIETEEIVCEHEFVDGVCIHCGAAAMQASFVCGEGATIDVLKMPNLDGEIFENAASAFPRASATGEIDISGEGQVNFVVNVAEGYRLESIAVEPASNYKNFKLPDETLIPNGYRITKMTGSVTVTVKTADDGGCEHDYNAVKTPATCTAQGFTTYTCSKCGDSYVSDYTAKNDHDYVNGVCTVCGEKLLNVAIFCGEGASVTVLETQKESGPRIENAVAANPRNGDTGQIDCSGEGQVNFVVSVAEGYELDSVTAEPAEAYKNLKGPEDTGIENGYRITKVKGDFTIFVKVINPGDPGHVHEYKAVITAPTCTEKGYTTYTCSCGDAHIGDEVAALGHDYQAVVTEPTCTEGGFTTHTCARCGDSYISDAAAALGHDFKNGVCTRCGEKETVPPPQVDKTALNEAVAAADEIDKTKYTEDSVKAFEEALKAARDVQTREDVTQDEVRKAAEDLRAAIEALAEKSDDFLFEDVKDPNKFYYDAVYWAYYADPQITKGTDDTHFGPDNPCTRGHVVTFLWRAAGCPAPKSTKTPFSDLKKDAFYEKAVAWAVEEGITKGLTDTTFGPDATCTRGQIVTFLWRFKGEPAPADAATPFKDVNSDAYYMNAVAWAVEEGVTKGLSDTAFGPEATCTRGQVVTFLCRAAGEE